MALVERLAAEGRLAPEAAAALLDKLAFPAARGRHRRGAMDEDVTLVAPTRGSLRAASGGCHQGARRPGARAAASDEDVTVVQPTSARPAAAG